MQKNKKAIYLQKLFVNILKVVFEANHGSTKSSAWATNVKSFGLRKKLMSRKDRDSLFNSLSPKITLTRVVCNPALSQRLCMTVLFFTNTLLFTAC